MARLSSCRQAGRQAAAVPPVSIQSEHFIFSSQMLQLYPESFGLMSRFWGGFSFFSYAMPLPFGRLCRIFSTGVTWISPCPLPSQTQMSLTIIASDTASVVSVCQYDGPLICMTSPSDDSEPAILMSRGSAQGY